MSNAPRLESSSQIGRSFLYSESYDRTVDIETALSRSLPQIRDGVAKHLDWLREKIKLNQGLRGKEGYQRARALDAALQELLGAIIDD